MTTETKEYRVLVLGKGRKRPVSYPSTGHPLYTRAEAIALLKRFADTACEAWAEGPHCRFDLDWLKTYPNWPELK
jgi:hypothetical protein